MKWYESDEGVRRLVLERDFLLREYPGFAMDIEEESGVVFAHGLLGPNGSLEGRYHVLVTFPDTYGGGSLPRAHVLEPEILPSAPHRFSDGSLCVEHGNSFTPRSSAVTFLSWVAAWLVLYEDWLQTGQAWD